MSYLKPIGLSVASLLLGGLLTVSMKAEANLQPSATPDNLAQATEQPQGKGKGRKGAWEQLGLSEAQKTQIQQIRAASRQQYEAILTPEQRQQWQAAKSQRPRTKPNLNLSEDQKARIKTIREQTKRQIDAVLTPEQRQKREELRQQWQQKRQQRQSSGNLT